MTSDQTDERQLEHNVQRLFERVVSGPRMPDATRARTLARLLDDTRHAPPTRARAAGWMRWAGLAAALVAAVAFLLWPANGSVTWAAVARHFERVRTLAAQSVTERLDGSSPGVAFRSRLYYKDPGMSRAEIYEGLDRALAGDPDRVEVLVRTEWDATELTLYPEEQRAERAVHTFSDGDRDGAALNLVGLTWMRLRDVAQSTVRPIGTRTMEGVRVAGFEVPAGSLSGSTPRGAHQPRLQVWAERETGLPVALVFQTASERTVVNRIRWNEPLPDDLFNTAGPEGWDMEEPATVVASEDRAAHKRPVSFAIQLLAGEQPLPERYISNADVGRAWVVSKGASCEIRIQMTSEGTRKLVELTRSHMGERLAMVIDGEVEMAPTIRSEITDGRVAVSGNMSLEHCQQVAAGLTAK